MFKQECIPVGCIPPASVAVLGVACLRGCLPRGVSAWGCLPRGAGCLPRGGGVCLEGCLPREGGVCLGEGCLPRGGVSA